jgi:hypothetical protein
MFNVQVNGRKRWFATLNDAKRYCKRVFILTGVILGIEKGEKKRR